MDPPTNRRQNSRNLPFGIMEQNAIIAHGYAFPRIRMNVVFHPSVAEIFCRSLTCDACPVESSPKHQTSVPLYKSL